MVIIIIIIIISSSSSSSSSLKLRAPVSVSSALGAAAAQQNNAKDVAAESSALHLPSCDRATHKGHTDADFLQQLFCCPLTQVSRRIAAHDEQACICIDAARQHQCNAWGTGSKLQRRLSSAVRTNLHLVSRAGSFH